MNFSGAAISQTSQNENWNRNRDDPERNMDETDDQQTGGRDFQTAANGTGETVQDATLAPQF